MHSPSRLFTFDFLALCLIIFLTYCNTTVFYSLDVHLGMLGIDQQWRGFLIGSSALATIASFLLYSPFMSTRNAVRNACLGAVTLMLCGTGYLEAAGITALLAVRVATGVGVYLLSASCMTLLVDRIPPERSGQAFGLYSVAILLPYSIVPAVFDGFFSHVAFTHGYFAMSLFLAPALGLLLYIGAKRRSGHAPLPPASPGYGAMLRDMATPPVGLLLLLTTLYITVFASVFFLAKGFFQERAFPHVGLFFAIQMACMIGVRVLASRVFDRARKTRLIALSFALTAVSCAMTALAFEQWQALISAVVMGVGMGLGTPAMNSLMFTISEPRFKGMNTNLMTMAQQMGYFAGPMLGSLAVHRLGYAGFLALDVALCCAALGICAVYARRGLDQSGTPS
ncbi:MAG: major facilitator superfamily [Desulfovibrionaceae bacterium]|nr:MAG: major facilitator superfamily [Desulfovibrionaceae bacterium]